MAMSVHSQCLIFRFMHVNYFFNADQNFIIRPCYGTYTMEVDRYYTFVMKSRFSKEHTGARDVQYQ